MFGLGDIDTSSRRVFPQRGVLSPPPPPTFSVWLGVGHIIYGPFGHGFKGCKREAELYWHMAVVGMYVQLLLFLKRALLASNFIVEGLNHIMGARCSSTITSATGIKAVQRCCSQNPK